MTFLRKYAIKDFGLPINYMNNNQYRMRVPISLLNLREYVFDEFSD